MPQKRLLQVLDDFKKCRIAQQPDFEKFYLYSLITHSTAIEGSTLTEVENQLLFDEGINVDVPVNVPLKLTSREKAIVEILSKEPQLTTKILSERLGISEKTIKRDIVSMKANGILKRAGSRKTGHWVIK